MTIFSFTRVAAPLLVASAALLGCGPSKAELAELERLDKAADELAKTKIEGWQKAMAAAKGAVVPRPDLGKCGIDVGSPPLAALERVDQILGFSMQAPEPTISVPAAELSKAKSGRARRIAWERAAFKRRDDRYKEMDTAHLLDAARGFAGDAAWTWDVTIVFDAEIAARSGGPASSTFDGGARAGRVYVYDYKNQRIACAGAFVAGSSAKVAVVKSKPSDDGQLSIDLDLDEQTMRAAFASIVAAGPPAK